MVSSRVPYPKEALIQRPLLWIPPLLFCLRLVQSGKFSLDTLPSGPIYSLLHQATNKKLAALNGLKFSVWTSRGAGLVLAYDGGLILLPMLRNIIRIIRPKLSWLFPADENIWFHRQVAYSMAFWAMVHVTAHYVNFINVERTRMFRFYSHLSTSLIHLQRSAQR